MSQAITKIFVASIRPIGSACREYAAAHMPDNCELSDSIESADVVFSIIYDKIFSKSFLEKKRCYNFHCGILPYYGGSNSSCWSIINREDEYGITLHEIDSGLDTGPVIDIQKFKIRSTDTAYSLYTMGEKVILQMFQEWFVKLVISDYIASPQPLPVKIYYKPRVDRVKDRSHLVRGLYFPEKESLYFYNKYGEKVYVSYDMRQEDFKDE